MIGPMKTACAYYRTSSATNVGNDKDSLNRQQDTVRAYAAAQGIRIGEEYYDAAVSGADPVDSRPGFWTCRLHARQRRPDRTGRDG